MEAVPRGPQEPASPDTDAPLPTDAGDGLGVVTRLDLERTVAALTGAEPHPVRIGPYRIVDRIGEGGMGTVLAARDERLERDVAIKVLRREVSARDDLPDIALDEARIVARLAHPNVVTVHEVGEVEGRPYFVMERIVGEDVRSFARTHPPEQVLDAYLQAARGLEAAHEAGIVHGDFKPENVLVDERGRARVIDFGVAALHVAMADAPRAGTPGYLAPEIARGAPPSPASDLYALAVSIYEGLTGRRPAGADDMNGPLPRGIPRGVLATLRRAAHDDPASRHDGVGPFVAEIERAFARRRTLRTTAFAAGALVAVFGLSRLASPPAGTMGAVPTDAGAPAEPSIMEVSGVHTARLANGLSVFVVPRRDAATVEARLVVRAGYPAEGDLPGLAHLALVAVEGGTERLGTVDPERDLRLREREAALFAELARAADPAARSRVLGQLARLREEAAGLWVAAPGETVLARWGARRHGVLQGWDIRTVAEIPRGRLVPYLALEAERLRAPVLRDFWGIVARTAAEAGGVARAVPPGERLADRLLAEHLGFVVDPVAEVRTASTFPYAEAARFLRERFVPGQAGLVLVGDLDPTMALAAVRRAFEGLPAGPDTRPYPRSVRPLPRTVVETVEGPVPRTDVAIPLDPADARVQVAADLLARLVESRPDGLSAPWHVQKVPFEIRFHREDPARPPDPAEILGFLRDLSPDQVARALPRLRLDRALDLETPARLADHLADAFTFGMDWADVVAEDALSDAETTERVVDLARRIGRGHAVVVRTVAGDAPPPALPEIPEPAAVPMADEPGPWARELESLTATEDTPRFLYEGRDYTLATADGRLFVAVPDDGPIASVQVDVPVTAERLAACAAAEILAARARTDENLRRARVDVRCTGGGLRLRVLARRDDAPRLAEALEGLLARPTTPDEIARARTRLERDLERDLRDARRLGAAARDLALFGDSAGVRMAPPDLAPGRAAARIRELFGTHLAARPDLAVTTHDTDSWQRWFEGLPAPDDADRPRRRLQRTPRRVVVPAPEAGVAYVAWAAAYGRIGPDDVATAEILRAALAGRLVALEREVGAQSALRVAWHRDGPAPAPGAALVAEVLVPPGRVLDTLAAVEAALAAPLDRNEVAAVRAQVERTYRTLGTPRHRIARLVRDFVLAGERSDPRARIWARLAQVDAATVAAAWRRLAEAPRIETIVTPRPSPAFEPSGSAPMVVVPAETLLTR